MRIFEQNIINMYGENGKKWLNDLPQIILEMRKYWGLSELKTLDNLTYNYVASGVYKNKPVILKLSFDNEDLNREALALKVFAGYGAVTIIDQIKNALLLERILPGNSLINYFPAADFEAIKIICDIMKKLYQAPLPKKGDFPTIRDWLTALDREEGVPSHYLHKAQAIKNKLLSEDKKIKLLHGDLHHYNCIESYEGWKVIDPKGVIGEVSYEVATFIRNPVPELLESPHVHNIISSRICFFSRELNLDKIRLQQWCFVQAVLGWIWGLEDGIDPSYFMKLTKFFDKYEFSY